MLIHDVLRQALVALPLTTAVVVVVARAFLTKADLSNAHSWITAVSHHTSTSGTSPPKRSDPNYTSGVAVGSQFKSTGGGGKVVVLRNGVVVAAFAASESIEVFIA